MRLIILIALYSASSFAVDLDWSGTYRVEANMIRNTRLGGGGDKEFFLHHLILKPKIIASDGLTIYGRLDLLNANAPFDNSQLGQSFGSGIGTSTPTSADNSNVLSHRQKSDPVQVTQLYLNYIHEYGSLIVGRAPLHFGLGMTYNAGEGLFDHWLETRDLVAYKVVFGNISLTPMLARVYQGSYAGNRNITDYMIEARYDNPETNSEMGVLYSVRQAGGSVNDAPLGTDPNGVFGGAAPVQANDNFSQQTLNIFVLKDVSQFRLGFEGSFLSGSNGVHDSSGNSGSFNAYGVAIEGEWRPENSKWRPGAKIGFATGDNPDTTDRFEGYAFNRNYDVAMLLFNYPLGKADFLRTAAAGGGPNIPGREPSDTLDTESISNVFYLAPYADYHLSDRFSLHGVLATGYLVQNPLAGVTTKKDLGYELDVALNYKIKANVSWATTLGVMLPGGAFKGDPSNSFQTSFAYGLQTRAAVRF